MKRMLSQIRVDLKLQVRNQLYAVGISISVILAVGLSQLSSNDELPSVVPALILIVIGATTMLYVAGLIMFEKEQGTLEATIVSPLSSVQYLWSKVFTLTALATLETLIMIFGATLIMSRSAMVNLPNFGVFLFGIFTIAIMYTLIGIILIVRYNKITDFLIPMATVIAVLQLPFLHFWGIVVDDVFLIIPTSAPTMLIQGAFIPLTAMQWLYAIGYSGLMIVIFAVWSSRAFNKHIIEKVG